LGLCGNKILGRRFSVRWVHPIPALRPMGEFLDLRYGETIHPDPDRQHAVSSLMSFSLRLNGQNEHLQRYNMCDNVRV
jgi:hypothetical protein